MTKQTAGLVSSLITDIDIEVECRIASDKLHPRLRLDFRAFRQSPRPNTFKVTAWRITQSLRLLPSRLRPPCIPHMLTVIPVTSPAPPPAVASRILFNYIVLGREEGEARNQALLREEEKVVHEGPITPRTHAATRLELATLKDIRRDLDSKVARMQARK